MIVLEGCMQGVRSGVVSSSLHTCQPSLNVCTPGFTVTISSTRWLEMTIYVHALISDGRLPCLADAAAAVSCGCDWHGLRAQHTAVIFPKANTADRQA